MKKGYPFLIFVAAALLTLAYQARLSPSYENSSPLVLATSMSAARPASEPAITKVTTISRVPASQAQSLEIEEVEAQN